VKLLFLTHRLPYAPNRGDRIRAYHLLKALGRFAEVTLVSLVHDAEEAGHVVDMASIVHEVHAVPVTPRRNKLRALSALATDRPLTHVLLDGPTLTETVDAAARERPSLVFAFCSGMARLASQPSLREIPLLHDMVDVDSAKWATLAQHARWPLSAIYARESRTLRQFEAEVSMRARRTFVVNERERGLLLRIAPKAPVDVLSQGVDTASYAPPGPPADRPSVVFTGVFDYGPNETAALWLMSEVWPSVVAARPDATLTLVGARPSRAVRRQAAASGVTVTGDVPDVRQYLWDAAVAVAPIFMSHGVQNKVLEAAAALVPAVITTPVSKGLPTEVIPACRVGDTADAFAREVLHLLNLTPGERRALAARADVEAFDWESTLAGLEGIVTAAAAGT
jgi:sugar transferase (PEP-CTERM/EpsH1 system associated)